MAQRWQKLSEISCKKTQSRQGINTFIQRRKKSWIMTIIWSLRMHFYVIIINVQPRCEIRFSAISKMESIRYKNLLIKGFVWKFVEIFGRLVHFSSFQRFLVENINYFFQFAGKILMKNVKSRQIFRFQWCHLLEERVVIFSHGNRK